MAASCRVRSGDLPFDAARAVELVAKGTRQGRGTPAAGRSSVALPARRRGRTGRPEDGRPATECPRRRSPSISISRGASRRSWSMVASSSVPDDQIVVISAACTRWSRTPVASAMAISRSGARTTPAARDPARRDPRQRDAPPWTLVAPDNRHRPRTGLALRGWVAQRFTLEGASSRSGWSSSRRADARIDGLATVVPAPPEAGRRGRRRDARSPA